MPGYRLFMQAAFAALAALTFTQPAGAQADTAMLSRLKDYVAEQGAALDWERIETRTDGGGAPVTVLRNARISSDSGAVSLPAVEIADAGAEDGGGWRIGRLTIPAFSQKVENSEFVVHGMSVRDLVLPMQGQAAVPASYRGLTIRDLTYNVHRLEIMKASGLRVAFTPPDAGAASAFTGSVEAFEVNLDSLRDPQTQATVDALGYRKLSGSIAFDGSWEEATGRLVLDSYDITVADAGTLRLSLDAAGVGLPFLAAAARLQGHMAAAPEANPMMGMLAAMGLLAQTQLHSARVSFEDDSLTRRAVAVAARRNGQDTNAAAAGFARMAEAWTRVVNDPELTRQTAEATRRFLADPRSLTIVVAPKAPVSGAAIAMGFLQGVPGLAQQLGIEVLANE